MKESKYQTDEERGAALLATQRANVVRRRESYTNVGVDKAVYDELHAASDRLREQLGFRPTISQTISYLLRREGLNNNQK